MWRDWRSETPRYAFVSRLDHTILRRPCRSSRTGVCTVLRLYYCPDCNQYDYWLKIKPTILNPSLHINTFQSNCSLNGGLSLQPLLYQPLLRIKLTIFIISAAFGIQYPQYSQYHFSISEAKPTTSICSENIEKDFSIPNTALFIILHINFFQANYSKGYL